jgi:hypothetical protein
MRSDRRLHVEYLENLACWRRIQGLQISAQSGKEISRARQNSHTVSIPSPSKPTGFGWSIHRGEKMNKFDVSIPRKMFWSDKLVNRKKCPLCHSALENEYHTYAMVVLSGGETTPFITGNDSGAFCHECPVVVLDRKGFEHVIEAMPEERPDWGIAGTVRFIVMGIVNMDAVPEDKRHLPLGDDDNPIPIVEFLSEIDTANRSGASRHAGKRLSGNQRRRRR